MDANQTVVEPIPGEAIDALARVRGLRAASGLPGCVVLRLHEAPGQHMAWSVTVEASAAGPRKKDKELDIQSVSTKRRSG